MSSEANVARSDKFFIGTDRTLEFTCYTTPAMITCRDMSGVALRWVLKKVVPGQDPYLFLGASVISKSSAALGGITLIGIFDPTPAVNTQRVRITIKDEDTLSLKAGDYAHALKDDTADAEDALAVGTFKLLTQAAL